MVLFKPEVIEIKSPCLEITRKKLLSRILQDMMQVISFEKVKKNKDQLL